jgi:5-methylcytosine-specific restriction endonuclease McrA
MSLDELRAEFDFFMRSGARCAYCRERVTHVTVSLDHRIPVKRGGWHSMSNLAFCCKGCNGSKGNMTDAEYRSLLKHLEAWEVENKNFTLKAGVLSAMRAGNSFRIGAQRRAKR